MLFIYVIFVTDSVKSECQSANVNAFYEHFRMILLGLSILNRYMWYMCRC